MNEKKFSLKRRINEFSKIQVMLFMDREIPLKLIKLASISLYMYEHSNMAVLAKWNFCVISCFQSFPSTFKRNEHKREGTGGGGGGGIINWLRITQSGYRSDSKNIR